MNFHELAVNLIDPTQFIKNVHEILHINFVNKIINNISSSNVH